MAYAASGQFDKAIATARQAIGLFEKHSDGAKSIEKIRSQIMLFEKKIPFREDWD